MIREPTALSTARSVIPISPSSIKRRTQRVQNQPASPGKVDAAKAGCGHASDNQEGGYVRPPQATDGGFPLPDTQEQTLAISALVGRRCKELGLSGVELVRRCGYKNISKGLRRLEQLHAGDFKRSVGMVRMLLAAPGVPVDVVKGTVEESQRIPARIC
jgi:hypothetical protein